MNFRKLGKSDLEISTVGLGTMSWPGCLFGVSGYEAGPADFLSAREMVKAALDTGINFFDTAEGYGRGLAEEILGATLQELNAREKSVIVTKVGPLFADEQKNGRNCDLSKANILARCEQSLKRLRTDYIDLYLAHWPDAATPIQETMEAAEALKIQGKIRWFGVSNFPAALMSEGGKHGIVAANQLPYSLVDRTIDADQRPFCVENDIGILAYSPLGKGVLSGKYSANQLPPADDYRHQRKHFAKENLNRHLAIAKELADLAASISCTPAQLAMAWVLAQPGLTAVLPGAKSAEQVRLNAAAAAVAIPGDILRKLNELSEHPPAGQQ